MKKKMLSIVALLFVMIAIFSTFTMTVYADDSNYRCGVCSTEGNSVYHDLTQLNDEAYCAYTAGEMIYSGNIFFEGSLDVIKFDIGSTYKTLWDTGKSIYDLIMPVGIVLVIIYALTEMMDRSMNDLQNAEYLVKGFMKMVVGIIVIQNGYDIATWVVQVGSYATSLLTANAGAMGQPGMCNYYDLVQMNMWEALGEFASLMIPWIIIMLCSILITVVCWIRILDIIVRVMFAPIGMADIVVSGMQSNGMKYLKRLGASALQGGVIFAIIKGYGMISGLLMSGLGGWLMMVILAVVCATLILKSSSISNEIMGV